MPTEDHYEDEIELTDCAVCGTLLPENLNCPQCGTNHQQLKEIIENASDSGVH